MARCAGAGLAFVLLVAGVGALGCGDEKVAAPAQPGPETVPPPEVVLPRVDVVGSTNPCLDILASFPGSTDGEYRVQRAPGERFGIYCAGMATGAPEEYLTLLRSGGASNYANWGGRDGGAQLSTHFTRVRLNPASLLVNTVDYRFSSSTAGPVAGRGSTPDIYHMPYATAADCNDPGFAMGTGNVDLTGTGLVVSDHFVVGGYYAAGSVNGTTGGRAVTSAVVNLTGGGYCGGTYPVAVPGTPPPVNGQGGFYLQLRFLGPAISAPPMIYRLPASTAEGVAMPMPLVQDPEGDALTVAWDLGDGTTGTGAIPDTHAYPDNGVYKVKVRVHDAWLPWVQDSSFVTISNVAPGATFGAPATVPQGGSIALTLSAPTDPSPADMAAGFRYAFDCGGGFGPVSGTPSASCPAPGHGSVTVRGKILDKDDGSSVYTRTVAVNNVAPTATLVLPPAAVNEGSAFTVSLSNPVDAAEDLPGLTYAFDCGTGYGPATALAVASCTAIDNPSTAVKARVIDGLGAASEYTGTVPVLNAAPAATSLSGPPAAAEGSNLTVVLLGATDPGTADRASLQFAFACGAAGAYGAPSGVNHTTCPAADGPGTLLARARVLDKDGAWSAEYTASITVGNVPPRATFKVPAGVAQGGSFTLALESPIDPSSADVAAGFSYAFDCGAGFGAYASTPSASCTATTRGTIAVGGRIRDKDGGEMMYRGGVLVENVTPTATFVLPAAPADEGGSFTLALTDPVDYPDDVAQMRYAFDCGQGYGPAGSAGSVACPATDDGSLTVRGKVIDPANAFTEYTGSVTVRNLPPAAGGVSGPGSVNEGTGATFSLVAPADPSPVDASQLTYAFACGAGAAFGPFGSTNKGFCPAPDGPATLVLRAKVRDKDGAESPEYLASSAVLNLTPSAAFSVTPAPDEGSPVVATLSGVQDVPADLATLTFAFDCGDGAGYRPATSSPTASCATVDNGQVNLRAKVLDKDGGMAEYAAGSKVGNVAPTVTLAGPASAVSGVTATFTGRLTDPGVNDAPWRYTFDWGAGTPTSGATTNQAAPFDASGTWLVPGSYTVLLSVTDKDGGLGRARALTVAVARAGALIDIKPGSADNPVNLKNNGENTIPVAVLSSPTLAAPSLSIASITLGGGAGGAGVAKKNNGTFMASSEDVNRDGRPDLVLHFERQALIQGGWLTPSTTALTLLGNIAGGAWIQGTDIVRILP